MKIRNSILAFFVIFCISSKVLACEVASLMAIYPIGLAENGLVAMVADINRYDDSEINILFRCKISLKIYKKYQAIKTIEITNQTKLKHSELEKLLKQAFQQCLDSSKNLKIIDYAKPVGIYDCANKTNCQLLSIYAKPLEKYVYLKTKEQKLHPIAFLDKPEAADIVHKLNSGYDLSALKIGSVKDYIVGSYKLRLVNLGFGDTRFTEREEKKMNRTIEKLDDTVFLEAIIHHGSQFDFFYFEK